LQRGVGYVVREWKASGQEGQRAVLGVVGHGCSTALQREVA
jgi:uncharacterized protein YebE (UPF0316 family)